MVSYKVVGVLVGVPRSLRWGSLGMRMARSIANRLILRSGRALVTEYFQ